MARPRSRSPQTDPRPHRIVGALRAMSLPGRFVLILVAVLALVEGYLFYFHHYPLVIGETDGIGYMVRSSAFFQLDPYHGPGYSWAIRVLRLAGLDPFHQRFALGRLE